MFNDFINGFKLRAEHSAQLTVIRLYQKGLVFQHVQQKPPGGVNHRSYFPAGNVTQYLLIGILGQAVGDTPRKHQHVAVFKPAELAVKLRGSSFGNHRTLTVNLSFLTRLYFDIYA